MKKFILLAVVVLIIVLVAIFFLPKLSTHDQSITANSVIEGVFNEGKGGGGYVKGVFIPDMTDEQISKFEGKEVRASGKLVTVPSNCPNDNSGIIYQCVEGDRQELQDIDYIILLDELLGANASQ
ncbi:hypothetical protein A2533_03540 [Candidatus Falkowbacteria bacterium RIFOXYD2_FULL_35_9]|uniref:Uncharacterized protein n=1 Tax=Candidatus Falkowbacteria bacterium RIFOXYC2_FULL_36_12 TaxID=1798002 RepID=A0A1F5T0H1_9BACT|nr:MAG: hypothetical protein A2300_01460 [Candidatus Falkowbacteria bacterium RIFOXYB2_FULL_35_7]OGF32412.1 MAG: hypothetical protein A2478_03775 [Candidatus Falkowbacteria bacterium RIFOXYC2_FULL_36_12]OGF34014.1 MAG: hypothetical protein A2223_03800 [Candidatus Falkowbacteria bacterium RIFOXYA2_FULL_35_8]OGF47381.1 MAG: hypothetical protein A2533_03540 [Candidatus Falkowbacteria bacterium RIFOXYD2_FULL_35_9]